MLLNDLYFIVQELLLNGKATKADENAIWVIGLSKHHQLLLMELMDSNNLLELPANEVFHVPLQKRADYVLLCQWGQSQKQGMSIEEKAVIRELLQVGYLINLPVLDYLLLDKEGYTSLKQTGELQECETLKPEKTPLTLEESKALTQEALVKAKQALEASYYKDREEIALHLYEEGLDLEQIMNITGLSEVALVALLERYQ